MSKTGCGCSRKGLFVHKWRSHGCGELPVFPCVLCIHQVATKACSFTPDAGIAFGCSGCWCSADVVSSWRVLPHQVTICPPRDSWQAAGALLSRACPELLLSPAAWPGPPVPPSDRGCFLSQQSTRRGRSPPSGTSHRSCPPEVAPSMLPPPQPGSRMPPPSPRTPPSWSPRTPPTCTGWMLGMARWGPELSVPLSSPPSWVPLCLWPWSSSR